jgi:hypothetical protein
MDWASELERLERELEDAQAFWEIACERLATGAGSKSERDRMAVALLGSREAVRHARERQPFFVEEPDPHFHRQPMPPPPWPKPKAPEPFDPERYLAELPDPDELERELWAEVERAV